MSDHGPTIELIKNGDGKIFGGYTDIPFEISGPQEAKKNGNTFLFYRNEYNTFKRLNYVSGTEIQPNAFAQRKMGVYGGLGNKEAILIKSNADKHNFSTCNSLENFELP